MLLFVLLDNDLLDRDRGDVIVFNNTSAEHPATYRFVRDCMVAARPYGIPFYQIEFQTYEDARRGEWTRLPTYRLVNAMPKSDANPDGFHWHGEVFEELISWTGYVPNQFNRICTRPPQARCHTRFPQGLAGSQARHSQTRPLRREAANGRRCGLQAARR